jgi:hypothetical protein
MNRFRVAFPDLDDAALDMLGERTYSSGELDELTYCRTLCCLIDARQMDEGTPLTYCVKYKDSTYTTSSPLFSIAERIHTAAKNVQAEWVPLYDSHSQADKLALVKEIIGVIHFLKTVGQEQRARMAECMPDTVRSIDDSYLRLRGMALWITSTSYSPDSSIYDIRQMLHFQHMASFVVDAKVVMLARSMAQALIWRLLGQQEGALRMYDARIKEGWTPTPDVVQFLRARKTYRIQTEPLVHEPSQTASLSDSRILLEGTSPLLEHTFKAR